VIHGGLKGVCGCITRCFTTLLTLGQLDILIDDSGRARISDFGLSRVTWNQESVEAVPLPLGYTPGWTAPEVLTEEVLTKEADIFSFAMVTIEVRHR